MVDQVHLVAMYLLATDWSLPSMGHLLRPHLQRGGSRERVLQQERKRGIQCPRVLWHDQSKMMGPLFVLWPTCFEQQDMRMTSQHPRTERAATVLSVGEKRLTVICLMPSRSDGWARPNV